LAVVTVSSRPLGLANARISYLLPSRHPPHANFVAIWNRELGTLRVQTSVTK
jgi:hypothetical protein